MIKKKYIKSKIKVYKFVSNSLCTSPDKNAGDVDPDSPLTESKSSGGIDWDFYENWDDNK